MRAIASTIAIALVLAALGGVEAVAAMDVAVDAASGAASDPIPNSRAITFHNALDAAIVVRFTGATPAESRAAWHAVSTHVAAEIPPGHRATVTSFVGHCFSVRRAASDDAGAGGGGGALLMRAAVWERAHDEVRVTARAVELWTGGQTGEPGGGCADRRPDCAQHVRNNGGLGCMANPGWMVAHCPASCAACHLADPRIRCARAALGMPAAPAAAAPGAIDAAFAAIKNSIKKGGRFARFAPRIVRQPPFAPWVAVFDAFLSGAECDRLVDASTGFARSADKGAGFDPFGAREQVVNAGRTSSSAWCGDACEADPLVAGVLRRIAAVTGVPRTHFEHLQVLRYTEGQHYRTHHDMDPAENDMAAGPRVLTLFMYLSDVEEGGETSFPRLGPLDVAPRKGRALLWPSVRSDDPGARDERTRHEAKRVLKGVKLAANAWIHAHEFRTPSHWGCSGVSMTELTSITCGEDAA